MLNPLKDTIPPQVAIAMLNCHRLELKNKISKDERDELLNAFAFIVELWITQKDTIGELFKDRDAVSENNFELRREVAQLREHLRKHEISKEPNNSRHVLNRTF